MGDGFPLGAARPDVIGAMVAEVGGDPDEIIGVVPPLRGELTAVRLAVCAALAGCDPGHVPVVAAMVGALGAPELNALGVLTTTSSAALATIVNGPVRSRLDFNGGANCLGPGNRSNAVVGRALSLITRIVGGAREGVADMATMGQPGKYTLCFAENEEASPWPPLHVERGLAADTSAVTVVGVAGTLEAFDAATTDAEAMVQALAVAVCAGSPGVHGITDRVGGGHQIVVVSPEWASLFARAGWSRSDLAEAVFERGGEKPGAPIADGPDDVMVVVAGGVGVKQTVMPGWAGGSAPVTVAVAR